MTDSTMITVETTVQVPVEKAWEYWNTPEHIIHWNSGSPDWHTPRATNDLQVGGKFTARMEAKDGSMGFDFEGTYTAIIPHERIEYTIIGGRTVVISFTQEGDTTHIIETFEAETENPIEMQKQGWQNILDNFKEYAQSQV